MIKALIQNGDDRVLLLNFPSARMKLAGSLTYLGINKPASEISCLADTENGISVKLFGDDAVDNKIISAVKPDMVLNGVCLTARISECRNKDGEYTLSDILIH